MGDGCKFCKLEDADMDLFFSIWPKIEEQFSDTDSSMSKMLKYHELHPIRGVRARHVRVTVG